jgi:hypothetical protein
MMRGVFLLLSTVDYLLTGESGLKSSATASLICSSVKNLVYPKRGICEHGKTA